jgi:hypothetical protein
MAFLLSIYCDFGFPQIVKNELIDQYATHLLENEQSGYSVLLHNNKV